MAIRFCIQLLTHFSRQIAFFVTVGTALAQGPPVATMDAQELRAALLASTERIESFHIVYTSDEYDDPSLPKGYSLRREVAAKAPASLFHWTSHGHDALSYRDDPYQQRARIVDGHFYNEFVIDRSYYEATFDLKAKGLPGSLVQEFLFTATGLWPLTDVKPVRPIDEPYVLREVAASKEYSIVRQSLEKVDGRWCHVLERPEMDRLWIDVDRGCALLARETHHPTTGRIAQRVELGDHREVQPGIWFPSWIRNVQYDHSATDKKQQRRVWKDAMHYVLEVSINDLEDSDFQWTPPLGALRVYDDAPSVQVKAGGLEHINHLVEWIRRNHEVTTYKKGWLLSIAYGMLIAMLMITAFETCSLIHRGGEKKRTQLIVGAGKKGIAEP